MNNSLLRKLTSKVQIDKSQLLDEETFYSSFSKDISKCGAELLIESPFVTQKRVSILLPDFTKLKNKRVKVTLITRDPFDSNDESTRTDALKGISKLQKIGVQVIFSDTLHRKIAIIDRKILYEGSLNIMSQNKSLELMRRIESVEECWRIIGHFKIDRLVN